jgi:prolyl oligopeptidase
VPETIRKPEVTTYHGVQITDEYQWLENGAEPAVSRWTTAQNAATRDYLERLPNYGAVAQQVERWLQRASTDYVALQVQARQMFALRFKPPAAQAALVALTSTASTSERVVFDPNDYDPQGNTSIDFFEVSPNARLVAICLSQHGSEAGTLQVFETETGRKLPDTLTRVQFPTAGGSVRWAADGKGFFYTRYPRPGERAEAELRFYQQIYYHELGSPDAQDRYEMGRELPRIAEIKLKSGPAGWMLAEVRNGDGGEVAHWLRGRTGRWTEVAGFKDGVAQAEFGREPLYIEWPADDSLYLLSHHDASRGKILKVSLNHPKLSTARVVLPESRKVLAGFVPAATGLYLHYLDGGPSELRFHDFYGKEDSAQEARTASGVETNAGATDQEDEEEKDETADHAVADAEPSAASAAETEAGGRGNRAGGGRGHASSREWALPLRGIFSVQEMVCRRGDELVFRTAGFVMAPEWQKYDPGAERGRVLPTAWRSPEPPAFRDMEVVRQTVVSKDGTKIPLSIIRRKGLRLDGQNPTLLTGYGGFGISVTPRFDLGRRVWFDQGGVLAVANLRGGGELGEQWHRDGSLTNKQHVFDDFIACAEFLIRSNYTSPAKLALQGGSNGGLLVGAALTQRPDLFRAVVGQVGLYDMLRFERDPNGQFNATEYGSVSDPEQFRALRAYSPYHRVSAGTAYPAVLLLTGEHDGRVNPAHSRKMTARLQAANTSQQPVLLRTSAKSGHGLGTAWSERVAQWADVYAFLLDRLGVEYTQVLRGPWSGGITATSVLVKARLSREDLPTRLAWSTSPTLDHPSFSPLLRSDTNHYNIVSFDVRGLAPDTQYYYALEVEGRLERVRRGAFRTFPEGPTSFSFAYASCARSGSTSTIFDTIRENRPLFFMNIGDFHYEDISTNDLGRFRAAYDLNLASPEQGDLYRSAPFIYVWDDHDFGGNNANRRARSHDVARRAYDEYVPHYPLVPDPDHFPISQSFTVGRVKFILTDLRSDRDPVTNRDDAAKSMLGPRQKEWFKKELLAANGVYPLICWVSPVPWIGTKGSNYYRIGTNVFGYIHHTQITNAPGSITSRSRRPLGAEEDHWSAYTTERRELADFIKANQIRGLCILHGDSHMLAADDGTYSDYATGGGAPLPVMCAAPLDREASIKGGPYSQGVYRVNDRRGEGGFGFVTITDQGSTLDVRFSGRNRQNEEKIALRFSVPATPPPPPAAGKPGTRAK